MTINEARSVIFRVTNIVFTSGSLGNDKSQLFNKKITEYGAQLQADTNRERDKTLPGDYVLSPEAEAILMQIQSLGDDTKKGEGDGKAK